MNNKINIKLPTPIDYYGEINSNQVYIKRDDLTDIAFGGNKARKIQYFFKDALSNEHDCIVTYGSIQSNHCRITSVVATMYGLPVYLIQPVSNESRNFNGNQLLNSFFEPHIISTPLKEVANTIELTLDKLKQQGKKPYFIQGGGHGDLGTHSYKKAYDEILTQEKVLELNFDYIYHASGTGTTQAGLLAGRFINKRKTNIVGISIARSQERGLEVIKDSLLSYLVSNNIEVNKDININFIEDYIGTGYADTYSEVFNTIKEVARHSGIFLDPIYTGKAFYGMKQHIEANQLRNKNILFIHTGGTPILFDYAHDFKREFDI